MSRDAAFSPTRWSLIAAVRSGEGLRARDALEKLCEAYWYPLYAYVRRAGHPPEDAAELEKAGVAAVYTPKDFELNRIMSDVVRIVERTKDANKA